MKFIIDKSLFAEALSKASRASATRSTIPVLEGVMIVAKDDKITVVGYDLEIGIKCETEPTEITEKGAAVINARLLGEIVKKIPAGIVEISTAEKTLIIRSGKIRSTIAALSADDFPNLPYINGKTVFEYEESVLKSMIRQTIHAVALTDIKPALMGIKFDIKDGSLTVVASDGVRMAVRIENCDFADAEFIVPRRTLDELMKILSDEPTESKVTVSVDHNQICFSKDDYTIISRLLEGSYLNYQKMMDFLPKATAIVSSGDFAAALDRTLTFNTDKIKQPTLCTFEGETLHIELNTNVGNMSEDIPIKYNGERFDTAFNAKYIIESLKSSECDEICIDLVAAMAPIKIRPISGNSYTAVVLPMRRKKNI